MLRRGDLLCVRRQISFRRDRVVGGDAYEKKKKSDEERKKRATNGFGKLFCDIRIPHHERESELEILAA